MIDFILKIYTPNSVISYKLITELCGLDANFSKFPFSK